MDDSNLRQLSSVLLVIALVASAFLVAGCLEDGGDGGPKVPKDRKDKSLAVTGDVGKQLDLAFADVMGYGTHDFEATFVNAVGTTHTANYTGIRLTDVLDDASPAAAVDLVRVKASDGYEALLFRADVDATTYIALKEDGEWNDLVDDGAFRLVDTDLPSVYWVRDIVEVSMVASTPLAATGLVNVTGAITAGWVKEHADTEVSWQEGTKTRTYTGVPMGQVLEAMNADTVYGNALGLDDGEDLTVVSLWDALNWGVLVVDSRGDYVYVDEEHDLVVKGFSLEVSEGLRVFGEVGQETLLSRAALSDLPQEAVETGGSTYNAVPMGALVAVAAPKASADAVKVFAGDGYSAVFPLVGLASAYVAFEVDGGAIEVGDGPYMVVDLARPGPYAVRWVTELQVYSSPILTASGRVNVTDVLDIDAITRGTDVTLTYNDGKKDRSYPGMSWDSVLAALDWDTAATHVNLTDSSGAEVTWDIDELVGRTDAGICVDPGGSYVAVKEELGAAVAYLASIEVG